MEAMPPPLQRTEGAPGSAEDRPASMDTEAMPLPSPPPLRMRLIFLSRKRPADDPPLAPLKALKTSPGSSAHWVVEAQAAIHRGATSAPGVSEAEATEDRAPKVAETAVAAVDVSTSSEDMMVEPGAPEITTAIIMATRPSVQEAEMKAAEALVAPLAQGPPLLRESAREAEVYPISSDDTSRAREVVDAEDTGVVEQPAPILNEGSSALVRA
ncbi:uncharacterized protein [Miscanthus floridulus]|uniref:uncharacterized protein n=1 Tax=Miscanthus floridulus TaxID=154761 RepID=UPI00345ACD52